MPHLVCPTRCGDPHGVIMKKSRRRYRNQLRQLRKGIDVWLAIKYIDADNGLSLHRLRYLKPGTHRWDKNPNWVEGTAIAHTTGSLKLIDIIHRPETRFGIDIRGSILKSKDYKGVQNGVFIDLETLNTNVRRHYSFRAGFNPYSSLDGPVTMGESIRSIEINWALIRPYLNEAKAILRKVM